MTQQPAPADGTPGFSQFARTVARNSLWGLGAQLSMKILSFGFSVLVLRKLGAEEYGQYAAVLAFGAMFVPIADLGIAQYTVREIARQRGNAARAQIVEQLYSDAIGLRLLLSVLTAALLIAAAWLTGRPTAMIGAIALGTLGLLMYALQGTSDAVLAGYERFDLSSTAKIVNQCVFLVLGGAALWFGFGYYGLIVANLVGIAAITWFCGRAVRRQRIRFRRPHFKSWAPMVRASVPFAVIGFTLGLSYKFDSVLLSVTRSDAETGYYNAAYNLVFSAAIISNVFNTALFPSLTRRAAGSSETMRGIYDRCLRYLLVAGIPIAVGVFAIADRLVPFLYTNAYTPAISALQIVIWVVPLMFLSEFLGYIAVVHNFERGVARSVLLSTGLNILVNLLMVPRFGFIAAAVMTVATEAVLAGQYLWMLRGSLRGINWQRSLLGSLVSALVMGGVLVAGRDLPLLLQAGIGALVYIAMISALRLIGPDELPLIKAFVARREQPADGIDVGRPPSKAAA